MLAFWFKRKAEKIYDVEERHKLQEFEGLRLANKLKSEHIQWRPQKQKFNLAALQMS